MSAIAELRDAGIEFGPASGREPVDLRSFFCFAKLKDGSYTLKVEATREEGGTESVAIPFTLPVKDKTEASAAGKSELGDISLTLTP